MKTKKFDKGTNYNTTEKKYIKSAMYEFDFNTDILLEEKKQDGTRDRTILHYSIGKGEKAYFSEEYLPEGGRKKGTKKPDITAIVENSTNKKVKWFIYDMKGTVINADTALKLCGQWHSGIEHITTDYLQHLTEYHNENSVGVITRYWDKDKLREEVKRYTEKLHNKNPLMTARKSLPKANEYREKIQAMQNIINESFVDCDENTGKTKTYKINYIKLDTTDKIIYTANMDIQL